MRRIKRPRTAAQKMAALNNIKKAQQARDNAIVSRAELGFFKRRQANKIDNALAKAAGDAGVNAALQKGYNKADIYKPGTKASKYALGVSNKFNYNVKYYDKNKKGFVFAHYSAKKITDKNSGLATFG